MTYPTAQDRWVVLRGQVLAATGRALKFEADTDEFFGGPTWIPRSMVEDGGQIERGDTELAVRHWWLIRRRA